MRIAQNKTSTKGNWHAPPRAVALLGAAVLALLVTGSCGGERAERQALLDYLQDADRVDAEWQRGVEAAYEGREYLAYGGLPDDDRISAAVLQDVETNLRLLIDSTKSAIVNAQSLDPPPAAVEFHEEWVRVLSDLVRLWESGLAPLSQRDYSAFVLVYQEIQDERENVNLRLSLLGRDREALGERARAP